MKLKTLYSTSLLLLVIIPIVAPLCFYIRQKYIRHEMEERFEKERLVSLTLTKLNWYKPGKELIINGRMFDVHAVKQLNNQKFEVEGLYDDDEKKLFKQLNLLMKKQGDVSKHVMGAIAIYCQIPPGFISHTPSGFKQNITIPIRRNLQAYSQYKKPVIGPPPRC